MSEANSVFLQTRLECGLIQSDRPPPSPKSFQQTIEAFIDDNDLERYADEYESTLK